MILDFVKFLVTEKEIKDAGRIHAQSVIKRVMDESGILDWWKNESE